MTDEQELIRDTDNPFRDAGLPEPETKLMKADLTAEIIRILRDAQFNRRESGKANCVQEADISRTRNAQLDRFTIDRLGTILNRFRTGCNKKA